MQLGGNARLISIPVQPGTCSVLIKVITKETGRFGVSLIEADDNDQAPKDAIDPLRHRANRPRNIVEFMRQRFTGHLSEAEKLLVQTVDGRKFRLDSKRLGDGQGGKRDLFSLYLKRIEQVKTFQSQKRNQERQLSHYLKENYELKQQMGQISYLITASKVNRQLFAKAWKEAVFLLRFLSRIKRNYKGKIGSMTVNCQNLHDILLTFLRLRDKHKPRSPQFELEQRALAASYPALVAKVKSEGVREQAKACLRLTFARLLLGQKLSSRIDQARLNGRLTRGSGGADAEEVRDEVPGVQTADQASVYRRVRDDQGTKEGALTEQ